MDLVALTLPQFPYSSGMCSVYDSTNMNGANGFQEVCFDSLKVKMIKESNQDAELEPKNASRVKGHEKWGAEAAAAPPVDRWWYHFLNLYLPNGFSPPLHSPILCTSKMSSTLNIWIY